MSAVGSVWRPEVALPLAALALVYLTGWTRLTRRSPMRCRPRLLVRLALALSGVAAAAVALVGLHGAAHESFAAHMVQHLLLIAVAVPALLLADPLPAVMWALPAAVRHSLRGALVAPAWPRRVWRALTRMPVAWTLYAVVLWAWHVPAAYDAALASPWLHDLEHVAFGVAAVVFWWPIIGPAPRAAAPPTAVARVVYLVLAAFSSGALGVLLAASPTPLYAYAARDQATGSLEDQAWGGIVMWAVGGAIDMTAILAVVARVVGGGDRRRVS